MPSISQQNELKNLQDKNGIRNENKHGQREWDTSQQVMNEVRIWWWTKKKNEKRIDENDDKIFQFLIFLFMMTNTIFALSTNEFEIIAKFQGDNQWNYEH